ncbi:MAG: lipopolysaccharide assembly protein LapB [Pseudohongiellaceae bacterium]
MEDGAIYLILLLAVITGWMLGYFSSRSRRPRGRTTEAIFEDYFVGLNYLLNDEPDEAIDTFIKALEINSDTVETHLALGALLRRRGKVDKAIEVHRTLLARPGLDSPVADSARLQLALNYIAAGLLDRAERLLREVQAEGSEAQWEALIHLITLYQTEKEWDEAIACSTSLLANPAFKRNNVVRSAAAHYCCELAEQHLADGLPDKAQELIKRAYAFNRNNVRATFLQARLEDEAGNHAAAAKALQKAYAQNSDFISQILLPLRNCYERMAAEKEYEKFLQTVLTETGKADVAVELAQLLEKQKGVAEAEAFLREYVQQHQSQPDVIMALLRLQARARTEDTDPNVLLLAQILQSGVAGKPVYQCSHCGYESRNHNWLCPSCHRWDTGKPSGEFV